MIAVGAGVIDRDYTGECMVILFNHGQNAFKVCVSDRVAQIVFEKIAIVDFQEKDVASSASVRGEGGFGHSGRNDNDNRNREKKGSVGDSDKDSIMDNTPNTKDGRKRSRDDPPNTKYECRADQESQPTTDTMNSS